MTAIAVRSPVTAVAVASSSARARVRGSAFPTARRGNGFMGAAVVQARRATG